MNILFKILGVLCTILFIVSAALQYNDPDPLIWILIWGLAAMISILFLLNKISFTITMILGVLSLIGFIYIYPSNFQGFDLKNGDAESIELGREAFGLLIIAFILFMYAFRIRYVQLKKKPI
jgi:membrane-bound ClpP family serine protease